MQTLFNMFCFLFILHFFVTPVPMFIEGNTVRVFSEFLGQTTRTIDLRTFFCNFTPGQMTERFGAFPSKEGVVFTVWAPQAQNVVVHLVDKEELHGTKEPRVTKISLGISTHEGIFSALVKEASVGTCYKFALDEKDPFPDPASRYQPFGVHGYSEVINVASFPWKDGEFCGVRLDDEPRLPLSIYEVHIGTFSEEGTFAGAINKLQYLKDLGVTCMELMPIADFPGGRNWGYDGVALFAPARCYGTPADLCRLVDTAHSLGISVILDVVYNHLGPDGNYLGCYSPYYFTEKHHTPWGPAPNIDLQDLENPKAESSECTLHAKTVRKFFLQNALQWIEEYHFDGLRLDATHTLVDNSTPHFLQELVQTCRNNRLKKEVVIFGEDERNEAKLILQPPAGYGLDGLWADDFHHQLRVMLAGDHESYFQDFSGSVEDLVETIKKGWFYCGQMSQCSGKPRGKDPTIVSSLAKFVVCIQNHDQVGNRAFGDRLHHQITQQAYKAASSLLFLVAETSLLFMGQEWEDHKQDLGKLVTEGRRREFEKFSQFSDPNIREKIPDPQAESTFIKSKLLWSEIEKQPYKSTYNWYKELFHLAKSQRSLHYHQRMYSHVEAVDDKTIAIIRTGKLSEDLPLVAIIQLKSGMNKVHLDKIGKIQQLLAEGKYKFQLLFSSEDEKFQPTPNPATRPVFQSNNVTMHGPAAVIFQLTTVGIPG